MLWACLYFPDLPLRAVFDASELTQACAVVDGPRQRPCVVYANPMAQAAGVRSGQPLAAARAVCTRFAAKARDRAAEIALLQALAAWCYRFSSQVSVDASGALLVEIGASLRLFGGWPTLERRLRSELAHIGYRPVLTVAPVPAAARVLANRHDGVFIAQREPMLAALGQTPLQHSRLDEDTITLLYRVGLRVLREVFALPRAEFARRAGPQALLALDRLRGAEAEILPLYRPPDRYERRIELDDRVEAWPPLLFPLRRLCNELALFLAARDGGVQRCELVLDHEGHAATRTMVELLTPQREARLLYELVRSRLERVALAHPVCGIALIANDLPTLRPQHQDLFEPKRAQALDWPELAERLRAHLGDGAVRQLTSVADHRPERAWRFEAANANSVGSASSKNSRLKNPQPAPPLPPAGEAALQAWARVVPEVATAEKLPHFASDEALALGKLPHSGSATLTPALSRQRERGNIAVAEKLPHSSSATACDALQRIAQARRSRPFWLLPRAIPLRGPPPRILAGPERIESGWWDGDDARRDYYVVQTREGQRAWAFLVHGSGDGWMLHGWFA